MYNLILNFIQFKISIIIVTKNEITSSDLNIKQVKELELELDEQSKSTRKASNRYITI